MKIIVRADDVGYTDVCNIGTFKAIEEGVVTSADVMLDTPGAIDALMRLKKMPWISMGWHTHFWGKPLCEQKDVITLIDQETGHFRRDQSIWSAPDIDENEARLELRTEMSLCQKYLGRVPDTADAGWCTSTPSAPFSKAFLEILDEYGIAHDYAVRLKNTPDGFEYTTRAAPRWIDRKIFVADADPAHIAFQTDSLLKQRKYDPALYYLEDHGKLFDLPEDYIMEQDWHPGYLDDYMYFYGDYGTLAHQYLLCRIAEVEGLCSDRLKRWVKEKRIELVNSRDALYDTHEYQNHLRCIHSDLCMM